MLVSNLPQLAPAILMISFNPGWSLAIMALGLLPNDSLRAIAQLTNATCLPQYGWMYNSKDQSPCLVAAERVFW